MENLHYCTRKEGHWLQEPYHQIECFEYIDENKVYSLSLGRKDGANILINFCPFCGFKAKNSAEDLGTKYRSLMLNSNPHIGSSFDDLLKEEGTLEQAEFDAKQKIMKEKKKSKK